MKLILGRPLTYPPLGSVTLDEDDLNIARGLLKDHEGWFHPEMVRRFENVFAEWNGSKYAFAFMGGRVALSACIHAIELKPGDEAILPGYTCVVVPNAFLYAGIKIVYCDIELDTFGLNAACLEDRISANTRAILLPHHYGLVCRDYEKIIEIAHRHGLFVIEDCCHGTGAEYKGRKIGNLGDMAFYSMEQSKVLTTIQGGIAVTNNELLAKRTREYWVQALYPEEDLIDKQLHSVLINYYAFKDVGRWWKGDLYRWIYRDKRIISTTEEELKGVKPRHYGKKMPSAIAAVGLNQLAKVDRYNQLRRQTAKKWDDWCDANGYRKPVVIPESLPVFLRYPVIVEPERKKNTSWGRKKLNLELGVWFETNIHPADWPVEGCPMADRAVKQCINFPGVIF